jgi:hypothetical protein
LGPGRVVFAVRHWHCDGPIGDRLYHHSRNAHVRVPTGDNINDEFERHQANLHDESSLLLLEGAIVDRLEYDESKNTELGSVYRSLLRDFLKWPLAKLRTEQFMTSLPPRTRFGIGTSGPSRRCVADPVLRFEQSGCGVGILR